MKAALDAPAAPEAPYEGMSTRSSVTPTTSATMAPNEESPGDDAAMSAFEKTAIAAKPSAPGSSKRNGVTEASNGAPKASGRRIGPTTAATSAAPPVTRATPRKARNAWSARSSPSTRAASGSSAVAVAAGR